ncbi:YeeE/YedE family protein [Ideonella alba]|uniref:YeeE/YedE family protein n=1 Tax=Ideonella alba TaxID=2824118 RepID=A0A941BF39_9BURK|nr:YeeE/YedE thiosulfate transporter family protein [Ideonella alba]MBQ0931711.1 YeeE/YedE family protein [Ideonella alba]
MNALFPLGWAHYLGGGLLIGLGVAWLFLSTGRIGGMSTVFTSTWSYLSRAPYFHLPRFTESRQWRLVYAAGLVLGAFLWWRWLGPAAPLRSGLPWWQLLLGGVLVGYGARLGNGCTSGHGICGLGSLQLPSLVAVLTFMATGFATANLVLAWRGH